MSTTALSDPVLDELVQIFLSMCEAGGYVAEEATLDAVRARFEAEPRGKGFGNARLARNLFEAMVAAQASRVVGIEDVTDAQLCALTPADVDAVPVT